MSHRPTGNDPTTAPAFPWGRKRTDRAVRRYLGGALLPGLEKPDGLIVLEEERIRARTVR